MKTLLILVLLFQSVEIFAAERSSKVRHDFARQNTCPSTGKNKLPCPGYVIDHITPLCAGGPDRVTNLQWQTVEEGKLKDREERALCRARRSQSP